MEGKILQFGSAASDHGALMLTTCCKYHNCVITGIVFVITQVILFGLLINTRSQITGKHITIHIIINWKFMWTAVPAIVLTVMVGFGLYYWFRITGEAPTNAMQVEVTGSQFKWEFRYPGKR